MPDHQIHRPQQDLRNPVQEPPQPRPGMRQPRPGRGNQALLERAGLGRNGPGQDPGVDAMLQQTVGLAKDTARQQVMDQTLAEFDTITITVPVTTRRGVQLQAEITIQTPYRINYTDTDYAVGHRAAPGAVGGALSSAPPLPAA